MSEINDCEKTIKRLLDKSQEAFILAIELFNRPTIQYRVEGCAFFLCNAWELMLKAHMINEFGYSSIYYPNSNSRTLSLEDCLKRIMTNDKDPVRKNIESIIGLRNTSTHFVIPEYEITYGPIFQANVRNFDEKLREFHNIEIGDKIPDNYLILSVNRTDLDGQTIRAKYSQDIAERLLKTQTIIDDNKGKDGNIKYAAYYRTDFVLSKKDGIPVRIDNQSETAVKINKLVEPKDRYPYRNKDVLEQVNHRLKKLDVHFTYRDNDDARFTTYHFGLFASCYSLKTDDRYSYDRSIKNESNPSYVYSEATINLIVEEIKKDPKHIIEKLKKKTEDKN